MSDIAQEPWHPDVPRVGLFANYRDAVAEASFRAAIAHRRYRVVLEPNNHWWQITEGFRLGSAEDVNRPRRRKAQR